MNTEIYPDQYKGNIYVTSDTHFGHKNIMKYEDRYTKLNVTTIEEHDNELIKRWNSAVKDNDLVYVLGDFSFYKKPEATMNILKILKGTKILIEGNHDCIYLENKLFDRSLFYDMFPYKEIKYKGTGVCLMHYVIQTFKHIDKPTNFYVHLHGHIHSCPIPVPMHTYNVGVDTNNYTPILLGTAIEYAKLNNGGLINGNNIHPLS